MTTAATRKLSPVECSGSGMEPFARRIQLKTIQDPTGMLVIAEATKEIGFSVRRIYFLTELDPGSNRGGHGHKRLQQCFICLRGRATLAVTKDDRKTTFRLDRCDEAVQVDAGCWRDLYDITPDALVLVLASDEYSESDYIRDYDEFRAWELESQASVPYIDLRRYGPMMGGKLEAAIQDALSSGVFIGGSSVSDFERLFSDYCGTESAVGVGNGLDALSLALRARGIGPGDEVVVPAHTFVATAMAVDAVGATPVLVDVEEGTGLIDPSQVQRAITERTKAVVPVHLYGHPADIDGIRDAVGNSDIFILEDAAQAHGALYKGRRCGSLADAAAFSFYPTKNLGAVGDAGAVTSDNKSFIDAVRLFGNYGSRTKYRHDVLGVNSRLDSLNARVLSEKLKHLDDWNAKRRELAFLYFSSLAGLSGLHLPMVHPWARPVWHVFPVRIDEQRDALLNHLAQHGVGANIHYPVPVHLQPCYGDRWAERFPNAETLSQTLLSLPLDPTHSEAEIAHVIKVVREFFGAA